MDAAVASIEECAFNVGFVEEGEAVSLGSQTDVVLDEGVLVDAEVECDGGDFLLGDCYEAGPAAAVGAALALVMD